MFPMLLVFVADWLIQIIKHKVDKSMNPSKSNKSFKHLNNFRSLVVKALFGRWYMFEKFPDILQTGSVEQTLKTIYKIDGKHECDPKRKKFHKFIRKHKGHLSDNWAGDRILKGIWVHQVATFKEKCDNQTSIDWHKKHDNQIIPSLHKIEYVW